MTEKKDRNGQFSKGIVARRKFQSSRSRCRYSFHEKYFLLFLQTFEFCKNSFGKHLRSKAFMFQNKVNWIYFFFFFLRNYNNWKWHSFIERANEFSSVSVRLIRKRIVTTSVLQAPCSPPNRPRAPEN